MRARKLAHWAGRLVAVAAVGVGLALGGASVAAASDAGGSTVSSPGATPDHTFWE